MNQNDPFSWVCAQVQKNMRNTRNTVKTLIFPFRALDDIWESIKELQYYRANVFKASTEEKKIVENGGSNNS